MADNDDLKVVNNAGAERFEVRLGDDVAFLEYRVKPDGIVMPHTEVPEAFAGKGVGGLLATAALQWARDRGQLVFPDCPFVAGFIRKRPEYHDLVAPSHRARLGIA